MNAAKTNQTLLEMIQRWDPFGYGVEAYETEAVDVIQAVHECHDAYTLAKKIQSIYEFSFEQLIPFSDCMKLAEALLVVKHGAECSLS
jgi:hypothetical protein